MNFNSYQIFKKSTKSTIYYKIKRFNIIINYIMLCALILQEKLAKIIMKKIKITVLFRINHSATGPNLKSRSV